MTISGKKMPAGALVAVRPSIAAHFMQPGIDSSEMAGELFRGCRARAGIGPPVARRQRPLVLLLQRIGAKSELPAYQVGSGRLVVAQ